LYQITYSSLPIWAALLSLVVLKRKLSRLQWISVFAVSAGLALSVFGVGAPTDTSNLADRTLGVMITLASTLIYSLVSLVF
jgi:drug/metabolite transporter (DMT)-like permease